MLARLPLEDYDRIFVSVCQPDWSRINCTNTIGRKKLIFGVCQTTDYVSLRFSRLSFPSDHATISAFFATYLILYFESKVKYNRWEIFHPGIIRSIFQVLFGVSSRYYLEYLPGIIWSIFQVLFGVSSRYHLEYLPGIIWSIFQVLFGVSSRYYLEYLPGIIWSIFLVLFGVSSRYYLEYLPGIIWSIFQVLFGVSSRYYQEYLPGMLV